MIDSKKIFLNTIISYFKSLLTIGISFFTIPILLNNLGVVDFGIFNLIFGVVNLLAFLNTAMALSTQRFLSYYELRNNTKFSQLIFKNSVLLHLLIGVIITIVGFILKFWMFDVLFNIPEDRIEASKVAFTIMIFTIFFNIISVPYSALLYAKENIGFVSIIHISEVIFKFIFAIGLIYISFDHLILYSIGLLFISFISLIFNYIFCNRKFIESHTKDIPTNLIVIKRLGSFAGWNLFGSLCAVMRVQGNSIILNKFFGATINASFGIATQVGNQLMALAIMVSKAINPQLVKNEGANNRLNMLKLSLLSSKYSYLICAFIAFPLYFKINNILKLWLKNVPDLAIDFTQLIIIITLISQLSVGIQTSIQATGKIAKYQLVVGTILLFNLPISFTFLLYGYPPQIVIIISIFIEIFAFFIRILFLKTMFSYKPLISLKEILLPILVPTIIAVMFGLFYKSVNSLFGDELLDLVIYSILNSILMLVNIYIFSLSTEERRFINSKLKKYIN